MRIQVSSSHFLVIYFIIGWCLGHVLFFMRLVNVFCCMSLEVPFPGNFLFARPSTFPKISNMSPIAEQKQELDIKIDSKLANSNHFCQNFDISLYVM